MSEFRRGDVIVKVDPTGLDPTVGPLTVFAYLNDNLYIVETKAGDKSIADGVEMIDLWKWIEWNGKRGN